MSMKDAMQTLRQKGALSAVVFGNHAGIIQSTLDFDYMAGKSQPSIKAVIGVQRQYLRYFWGEVEIVIPGYVDLKDMKETDREQVDLFAVAQSGRRALSAVESALEFLPHVKGGMIFAEGVSERHALELRRKANQKGIFILGPASVGFMIAGGCKIGAIGGTLAEQMAQTKVIAAGSTAVVSTSGGMTNELINMIAGAGSSVSFAAAVGGERYPVTKPVDIVEAALNDTQTQSVVFFGEVGGRDEYEVAEIYQKAENKKPLICYIAGQVAESFEDSPQFGHAKALAQNAQETASAKKQVLRAAGAYVADSFIEFENLISQNTVKVQGEYAAVVVPGASGARRHASFVNTVSSDKGGSVKLLGEELVNFVDDKPLSHIALAMFLGHQPKSPQFTSFIDTSVKLLVDHGPQVSGAVNTMITARAGKDLTAGLAAGLLTIGSRFGGAINEAAVNWLNAVSEGANPHEFVEGFAKQKVYIAGIGHKKYRVDSPDPRVKKILDSFTPGRYTSFALEVQKITTNKKAQLILNVDGLIAAMTLDMLEQEEGYTEEQIRKLIATEFFNAIFVYGRTVGLIAHFLDQKRLDEGLFRLADDQITNLDR